MVLKQREKGHTGPDQEAAPDELGNIVVKLPLPPGFSSSLWENDELFEKTYFSKFKVGKFATFIDNRESKLRITL